MELHPWWLQKKTYYHKGTWHNTCYWDLIVEVWDKHHVPWQYNEDCYKAIEVFEGERNVKDLQALGDVVYNQP
jgi:hypothetical protein